MRRASATHRGKIARTGSAAINLRNQNADVAGILVDLTLRETMNEENRFAGMLLDALDQGGVSILARTPHRSAGFAVLKAPDIPSVLLEMGYLSDIGDAQDLASPQYRARIARAIVQSVDRYFSGASLGSQRGSDRFTLPQREP